jgi:hypothetical protein
MTFDDLTVASNDELDRLMVASPAPTMAQVIGFEYRGYNLAWATELLGTRKFKKGFYGEAARGYCWGYNVPVEQNGKGDPWIAKPSDANPTRYYFFKVFPAAGAPEFKYPASLVVDYKGWDEYHHLNPVRYTVDYLVIPEPANPRLLLGKSYFENDVLKMFLGYFVLEQHNSTSYAGPPFYPAA